MIALAWPQAVLYPAPIFHMDSIWTPCGMKIFHGIHMESTWNPHGFHGHSMVIPYGLHMDSMWNENIPWNPHGIHMDSMVTPWSFHGHSMFIPLGFQMELGTWWNWGIIYIYSFIV